MDLPLWTRHVHGATQHVAFCAWLLPRGLMLWSSSALRRGRTPLPFTLSQVPAKGRAACCSPCVRVGAGLPHGGCCGWSRPALRKEAEPRELKTRTPTPTPTPQKETAIPASHSAFQL